MSNRDTIEKNFEIIHSDLGFLVLANERLTQRVEELEERAKRQDAEKAEAEKIQNARDAYRDAYMGTFQGRVVLNGSKEIFDDI